jgi:2-iminobutanoate/2-iminopropanoate deaminase
MQKIQTETAPIPAGHYSQAVVHNGIVYVAGQLPIDVNVSERHIGTIEEQTKQALKNVSEILQAAGSELNKVLKATVYISDIQLWSRVNEVYSDIFGDHRPARVVVPTKELHHGYQIEVDAIAAVE